METEHEKLLKDILKTIDEKLSIVIGLRASHINSGNFEPVEALLVVEYNLCESKSSITKALIEWDKLKPKTDADKTRYSL